MDVEFKDRKENIEIFRIACVLCDFSISYANADLILRVLDVLEKKGGKSKTSEFIELKQKWEEDYNFNKLNNKTI